MSTPTKRIAILTSGGDCAGLNAVIRAVVLRAETLNWEVIGIHDGTHGLLETPAHVTPLRMNNVDTILRQGGTILGTTNKGDPFAYPMPDGTLKDRSEEIITAFRKLGCEALIGIGGDGSLAILSRLAKQGGFPLIGIPKTIDNDLGITEMSVGFGTAVDVATEALDRLQPTAASHDRIMVLEVMGRDAGHIALTAGIAGGADVILIPEIPYDIKKVAAHIKAMRERGRNFALVVVSEAVKTPDGESVSKDFFGGQKRLGGIAQSAARIAQPDSDGGSPPSEAPPKPRRQENPSPPPFRPAPALFQGHPSYKLGKNGAAGRIPARQLGRSQTSAGVNWATPASPHTSPG